MSTRELVTTVLSIEAHWEQDLSQIPGLVEQVAADLNTILFRDMYDIVQLLYW